MNRKITLLLLLLTVVALIGVPEASAFSFFLTTFEGKYPSAVGSRIDTCNLCHVGPNPSGNEADKPRNPYGLAFQNNGANAGALTTIESFDNDTDGFSNIDEIHNLTFPGNVSDFPPKIIGFAPLSPTTNNSGVPATRIFNVTVNQIVDNLIWTLDGAVQKTDHTLSASNAPLTVNVIGIHTVSLTAQRTGDGAAIQAWTWNVETPVTVPTFSISGFKINNDTGTGVPSWPVTLTNGTITIPTTTNNDGKYQFTGLANGTYTVTETVQSGWTNITPTSIDVLIDGADVTNQNFTNTPPPVTVPTFSISGFKINNDTGTGVPNWQITLTNNTISVSNTTNSDGMYQFTGLANGTYKVTETVQSGWTNVTPTSIDVLIAGADMTNQNFTNTPPSVSVQTFSISGFKINNDTGVGVPNWQITLTNNTISVSNTTNSDGMYQFTGLANGTYKVTETVQSGWTNVTPTSIDVLIAGADMTNQNFTNMPPSVSVPTAFLLTPDTSVVLKGTTININVMAVNDSLPQPLFNGTANIAITANNMSAVSAPINASFKNGNATIQVTSSIAQFVTITATNGTITGNTMVEFADMVIDLKKGFNLISIPAFANPSNISQALQLVPNNGVMSFDPATNLFVTPTDLQPLFGYWINVTADNQKFGFIADTSVVIVPPIRNLFEGWNLIGISTSKGDAVDGIRLDMAPKVTFVDLRNGDAPSQWMYSRLTSFDGAKPQTFTAGVDLTLDLPPLKQGRGYWLFIKSIPSNKVSAPWAGKLW